MPGSPDWINGYEGMSVAVTGAAGFLGARLVERLATTRCRIVRVSRRPPPAVAAAAGISDVIGDVADRGPWEAIAGAEVVFHFAAQTSVTAAAADPQHDFDQNVTPLRHLIEVAGERGWRPLVLFAGTVTQAGIPRRLPVNEDAADEPVTVYDRHKLMAEDMLKSASADGGVRGASLRLSNVYGPGGRGGRRDRDVLNRMIRAALRGESLTVHEGGAFVRDYVFIDDVVDAFARAATSGERVNGRHFVIGSGRGTTIRAAFELIAARVEARIGRRVAVVDTIPATVLSPLERRDFIADASRFCEATGWRAEWGLSDGIDRTIEAALCA